VLGTEAGGARAGVRADARELPVVDGDGILWRADQWVALSPIEARLARAFLEHPGRLLGRATLGRAGWPDGVPNDRAVDSRIKTLRRRVTPLGLRISTVRGRGYLAEVDRADPPAPSPDGRSGGSPNTATGGSRTGR
jgi:DNA-binding response OmpR family regulator